MKYLKLLLLLFGAAVACRGHATDPIRGHLPNGLRYIIHSTADGSKSAELRLVMGIGSCVERDDERGYAHMLEHLAFGGSEHFPHRGMIKWTESKGIRYGIGLNAYTTHDHTMYMMSLPTVEYNVLDTALLVVHDWINGLSLTAETLEGEKGIVQEEIRVWVQDDPFYDLKIGKGLHCRRMPLGMTEDIDAMEIERMRAFYKRWYRPEYATLLIVGDVAEGEVIEMIRDRLGGIGGDMLPLPTPPDLEYPQDAQIAERWDDLTTTYSVEYIIPHQTLPTRTLDEIYNAALARMALTAWKNRLYRTTGTNLSDAWYLGRTSHLTLSVDAPSVSKLVGRMEIIASTLTALRGDKAISKEEMAQLIAQAKRWNPLVRTDDIAGLTDYYVDEVLHGDHPLTNAKEVEDLHGRLDSVSPEQLRPYIEILRQQLTAGNALLAYTSSGKKYTGAQIMDSLQLAIKRGIEREDFMYVFASSTDGEEHIEISTPGILLDAVAPRPDLILSRKEREGLGLTELFLSNGIHVVLKPTTASDSIVKVSISVPGGHASVAPEEEIQLESLGGYMELGLIQTVPREQLSEYMMQNRMSMTIIPDTYWYGIVGQGPKDKLTEFFRLLNERILHPEIPLHDMESIRSELLPQEEKNPDRLSQMVARDPVRMMQRAIDRAMGEQLVLHEPRSREEIEALDITRMVNAHTDRLTRTEGMYIIVTGDFDVEKAVGDISGLWGRLPRKARMPIRQLIPDAMQADNFTIESEDTTDKIDLRNIFVGSYTPCVANHLKLKLTRELLRNRLIERLRTQEGIVYSPYTYVFYRNYPQPQAYFILETTLSPTNVNQANGIITDIISDLQNSPVDEQEIEDIRRSFLANKKAVLTPENTLGWQENISTILRSGEALEDFERYEELLRSITPEELCRFLQEFFSDSRHLVFQTIPKTQHNLVLTTKL